MAAAVRGEPALVAVLTLAAALRLPTVGSQSLWEDETVTRWVLGHSFGGMLHALARTESTPPLSYVLSRSWTRVAGTGALALRSLSALAGLATVALVYLLARELAGARAGGGDRAGARAAGMAGLLAALSPDLVWYSQEARSYALYVALVTASVLATVRALRAPSAGGMAIWALVCALALATHYFAVFLVAAELAWLLRCQRPRAPVLRAALAPLLTGVALLGLALSQHRNGGSGYLAEIPLGERVAQAGHEYLAGPPAPRSSLPTLAGLEAMLLVAMAGLCLPRAGEARRSAAPVLALAALALALPLGGDLAGLHAFDERNAMGVLGLLIVAAACGLAAIPVRAVRLAAVGAGALAAGVGLGRMYLDASYQRQDWRAAAALLGPARADRALVIAPPTLDPAPVPAIVGLNAYRGDVRGLPTGGARVCEIDALNVRGVPYYDDAPAPHAPPRAPRGFRSAGVLTRSNVTVWRFLARRPRLLDTHELSHSGLLPADPDVMAALQPGGPRTPRRCAAPRMPPRGGRAPRARPRAPRHG